MFFISKVVDSCFAVSAPLGFRRWLLSAASARKEVYLGRFFLQLSCCSIWACSRRTSCFGPNCVEPMERVEFFCVTVLTS